MTKKCSICLETKDYDNDFYIDRNSGKARYCCKECDKRKSAERFKNKKSPAKQG